MRASRSQPKRACRWMRGFAACAFSIAISGCSTSMPPLTLDFDITKFTNVSSKFQLANTLVRPEESEIIIAQYKKENRVNELKNNKIYQIESINKPFYKEWRTILREALQQSGLFQSSSAYQAELEVIVTHISYPTIAGEMNTEITTKYILTDKKSGDITYQREISSNGRATISDEFFGGKRLILSHHRAVSSSIEMFIKHFSTFLSDN